MVVEIRYQRVSDAKRFYDILNSPRFLYFSVKPESVDAEKDYLRNTQTWKKKNLQHNFTILYNGKMVGGGGLKINQHRKHIAEVGYFVDYEYWGKGIATKTVKLLEKKGKELGIKRFEIYVHPKNKASQKVALKSKYKKEALVSKSHPQNGKLQDMVVYVKTVR